MDDRAPGVSAQLRKRIGTLLGAGETVSLRRSTLVLKDVVLTKANGSETPAAAEMRLQVARRGLAPEPFNLERWDRTVAVERIGDRTFALDRAGARHLVTRRFNGSKLSRRPVNVSTKMHRSLSGSFRFPWPTKGATGRCGGQGICR